MDIITNLVTTPASTSAQSTDISISSTQSALALANDDNQSLDISQEVMLLNNGSKLPHNGNNAPVVLNFETALKEVIQLQQETTDNNTQVLNAQIEKSPVLDKTLDEDELILGADFGLLMKQPLAQAVYQVEKGALIQQDEKLSFLIKQPVHLNEITPPVMDAVSLSLEESKQTVPVLGFVKELENKISLENQSEADVEMESVVNSEDTFQQSVNLEQLKTKSQSQANTLMMKEVSSNEAKEDLNISLKAQKPYQESNEVVQSEPITSEYQAIQDQIILRKNETLSNTSAEPKVLNRETFAKDLTDNVQVMINSKENSAQVDINPPDLGKIEIKIVQDADKTHISFLASQQETQALIEASIDRLKTQVEMQGLNLGNVTVSHGDAGKEQEHLAKNQRYTASNTEDKAMIETNLNRITNHTPQSMLDIYA